MYRTFKDRQAAETVVIRDTDKNSIVCKDF